MSGGDVGIMGSSTPRHLSLTQFAAEWSTRKPRVKVSGRSAFDPQVRHGHRQEDRREEAAVWGAGDDDEFLWHEADRIRECNTTRPMSIPPWRRFSPRSNSIFKKREWCGCLRASPNLLIHFHLHHLPTSSM